jgi:glycosyltransferase involved in cell wall biosynthesis
VCICTYRRPDELRRLLDRIVEEGADIDDIASVGVIVVDDAPDRSAEPVVARFGTSVPLGAHYAATASGNISIARNRAVVGGLQLADLLVFIDDDCLPDPGWLRALLTTRLRTGAEIVSGCCLDEPPAEAPRWLMEAPFLSGPLDHADGEVMDVGAMKNTLVTAEFLRRTGLRFESDFGMAGGEDVMWFRSAQALGATVRYSAGAVVREVVPLARTSTRYVLRRAFWYGNTEAVTSIAAGKFGRGRMLVSGAKRMLVSLCRPFARLARGRSPQWRYATSELLRGIGRMLGAAGFRVRHH